MQFKFKKFVYFSIILKVYALKLIVAELKLNNNNNNNKKTVTIPTCSRIKINNS